VDAIAPKATWRVKKYKTNKKMAQGKTKSMPRGKERQFGRPVGYQGAPIGGVYIGYSS